MKLIKTLILSLMVASLVACGGGGSGGGSSTARNLELTEQNLYGVYDWSENTDEGKDVYYIVLDDDGMLYESDYLGDEYDDYDDCYDHQEVGEWTLDGNHIVVRDHGDHEARYEVRSLTTSRLVWYDIEDKFEESFPRTDLSFNDLSPDCVF